MSTTEQEVKSTELVVIQQTQVMDVFTKTETLHDLLHAIAEKVKGEEPDVYSDKGRKKIASLAYKVAQSKTYIEGHGKALADEVKQLPKTIDAHRKLARDFLDNLRDEIRAPLNVWEAEQEAIKVKAEIELMHQQALLDNEKWETEKTKRMVLEAAEKAGFEEEFKRRAKIEAEEAVRREILEKEARAIAAEAEAKELKESQARRIEHEKQLAIEKERKRIADDQKLEAYKQSVIAAEKATEDHRAKIHDDVYFSLLVMTGLTEAEAKTVLKAIIEGKIDHLKIEY